MTAAALPLPPVPLSARLSRHYRGEMLPRRIVGQCGAVLYAIAMHMAGGTYQPDTQRIPCLVLSHALHDVCRSHGVECRDFDAGLRFDIALRLVEALNAFPFDREAGMGIHVYKLRLTLMLMGWPVAMRVAAPAAA